MFLRNSAYVTIISTKKHTNRFWEKLNGFTMMQLQECMVFRKSGEQWLQSCLLNNKQRCTKQNKTPSNHVSIKLLFRKCNNFNGHSVWNPRKKNAKDWNATDLCVWCSRFWGALLVLGVRRWNFGILAFCPAII